MNTPYERQVTARANYDPNLQADDPARRAKEEKLASSTGKQLRKRVIERGSNNYLLRIADLT